MPNCEFQGPLFVVGMPRSGTKLLRDLLNQHSRIGIPICESHFIPYFVTRYGDPPAFGPSGDLGPFLAELRRSPFITDLRSYGVELDETAYAKRVDRSRWASIFRELFSMAAAVDGREPEIWGDKTPGYLAHMPLLKTLFPSARFLHIVRDPRDYCLSVKRTWGKSLYRAAQRWQHHVSQAHSDGESLGAAYREVRYESLLADTPATMRDVAAFIGVAFEPQMCALAAPAETLGDARGRVDIVRNNTGKFLDALSDRQLGRIEEIVWPTAQALGYAPVRARAARALSQPVSSTLRIYDGLKMLGFYVSEFGLRGGYRTLASTQRFKSWV